MNEIMTGALDDALMWLSVRAPLEFAAMLLCGAMYLLVGVMLTLHWLKHLPDDRGRVDFGYESWDGGVIFVLLFLYFAIVVGGAFLWPFVWGLVWLYRGARLLASAVQRTM